MATQTISAKDALIGIMKPINARSRRVTPIDDGWAAICDDPARVNGVAVIVTGDQQNQLAAVKKVGTQYQLASDGSPVVFKGWVLATVRVVGTPLEEGAPHE